MAAFTDPVKTVAGSDHPRIRRWTLQIFAKVFKHGWRRWRDCGKIIESFVNPSSKACSRDVVAKDSAIYNLCEKRRLRNEFTHHVRDVLLPLRRKCFLITRPAPEGHHHDFSFGTRAYRAGPGGLQQSTAHRHSRSAAQELPPGA